MSEPYVRVFVLCCVITFSCMIMFPPVSAFEADGKISEDPKDYLHHTQNTHASKQAKCSTYTYKPFLDLREPRHRYRDVFFSC